MGSSVKSVNGMVPFSAEEVAEWSSLCVTSRSVTTRTQERRLKKDNDDHSELPTASVCPSLSLEEREALREIRSRRSKARKQLLVRLGPMGWSERGIERALDRLVQAQQLQSQTTTTTSIPAWIRDRDHCENTMDHRPNGGPLLRLLWCEDGDSGSDNNNINNTGDGSDSYTGYSSRKGPPLRGQTLYLGAEVASDGIVYMIPGHADRVLTVDPSTDRVRLIGPNLSSSTFLSTGRWIKWLRGIVVRNGDVIYGLPCHADTVLRIDVTTRCITTLPIPYEKIYGAKEARRQRRMTWKYHGGEISPLDGCVYAIPQSASHVLKMDVMTEQISMVGPSFAAQGRWKWYGGILGRHDGAIYGIPHNATGVLRIHPYEGVTVHPVPEFIRDAACQIYDEAARDHLWHGGAAASDGTIVGVPANADTVLCVTPLTTTITTTTTTTTTTVPSIHMYPLGDASTVRTGRHRDDAKYKYLGATCGPDGCVYFFPSASEHVLRVDPSNRHVSTVGPNLLDAGCETVMQNKWQNGIACPRDGCVYGMPLSSHTILRIDCSSDRTDVEVTTWTLPSPKRECRDKYEGGVLIPSTGVMYTVPNNHKAVLRIEP